ncbi:class I SAM-dependent methyltransferase [Nonomuraea deserti]|uniref:class I SAM-dependent methyltransferase n=1 Tax=Nonomuraea deserti TaxID=1848322 RepID=UPI00319D8A57
MSHAGAGVPLDGRRILDAGCGSGPLCVALRDRGAVVTGIDAGAGMLATARRRLGDGAATTRTCTWPTYVIRCRSTTTRSTGSPSR